MDSPFHKTQNVQVTPTLAQPAVTKNMPLATAPESTVVVSMRRIDATAVVWAGM